MAMVHSIFGHQTFKFLVVDLFHFWLPLNGCDQFGCHQTAVIIFGHWLKNGD
jgi:hypothetical protein